ncbi:hypothetical protein [Cryobacterium algoritolerans]|uniref:hypothetical protein n=1 Tax=Cryobacterium algoritolerans TaxID=1259184 RepID=UPI0018E0B724|nr:hypothetical protein [Cryobacterium algoritolerans]
MVVDVAADPADHRGVQHIFNLLCIRFAEHAESVNPMRPGASAIGPRPPRLIGK